MDTDKRGAKISGGWKLTLHEDGGVGVQGLPKHSVLRLKNRKNRHTKRDETGCV